MIRAFGFLPVQLWTHDDNIRFYLTGLRPTAVFVFNGEHLDEIIPVRQLIPN